ncbi:MAG: hypothetical protein EB015_19900, partial [Methylocystaceae bacterium]|nr:hypothetical protein [Methylocystaceae bacterium]
MGVVMKNGPYARAARELSARGLAVIPVRLEIGADGKNVKKPMTHWIGKPLSMKYGARGITKLTQTFGDENIGILCKPSHVTIVDIDDTSLIDDMRKRFGDTPLQTESPSGGVHLWYRANGESCRNLRASEDIAVDIKAGGASKGGLIVVPPSTRPDGKAYRFIEGDWEYLEAIPTIRLGSLPDPPPKTKLQAIKEGASDEGALSDSRPGIGHNSGKAGDEGHRNDTLFKHLLRAASTCGNFDALLAEARDKNSLFVPPLGDAEVIKVSTKAWSYQENASNWNSDRESRMALLRKHFRSIFSLSSDAVVLLHILVDAHGKSFDPFPISPAAMLRDKVVPSWGLKKYKNA